MNRSVAQTEIRADDRTLRTLAVGNLKGVGGDYLITVGNCIKIVGKIILIINKIYVFLINRWFAVFVRPKSAFFEH